MDTREALAGLERLGAAALPHVDGDLLTHLQGTHDVLRRWGAAEPVCVAGLYHAVYGTAGFSDQLLPVERRSELAALIGPEAEQLVYLFAACDRGDFYTRLARRRQPLRLRSRFSGKEFETDAATVAALCELTLANELDLVLRAQGKLRPDFMRFFAALVAAMRSHVSAAALAECDAVLARAARPGEEP